MPKTVRFFRFFCGLLVAVYLAAVAIGVVFIAAPPTASGLSEKAGLLLGILFILTGLLFAAVALPGFYLPRRSGAWTYGHILICLGLTSVVLLPVAVPLLYFWFRPGVKDWFGVKGP